MSTSPPDDASLRMAAEVAGAWSAWVLSEVPEPPGPPSQPDPPAPPVSGGLSGVAVDQIVRSITLLAAAVDHAGQGVGAPRLIALAKPMVVWAEGTSAARAQLKLEGDPMPITVDSANSLAVLSFEDDHGDPVSAPDGAQASATSDNTSVLNVGTATPGTDSSGNPTLNFPLTPVAEGTANLSVSVTGADGGPLLGPDGTTPIPTPDPVAVQVNPGAAAEERFVVPDA